MKKWIFYALALLGVAALSCKERSSEPLPTTKAPDVVVAPSTPEVTDEGLEALKNWGAPTFILPQGASQDMATASEYFKQYANTDDFFTYFKSKVTTLKSGNALNVEVAVASFRKCLRNTKTIEVYYKGYSLLYRNVTIGGWDGYKLRQNPRFTLDGVARAGHWMHEVSHACGFTHDSNSISKMPSIAQSFPYVVGYKFEEFLKLKASSKVAGE